MEAINEEIKRSILRQYVKNIVCIDDDFHGIYCKTPPKEMERQLYKGLFEETSGFITMQKYENNADICATLAEKSDMVILDWELEDNVIDDNFSKTLLILERVLKSKNSLICIYTQVDNELQVYDQIQLYFSGNTEVGLDELRKKLILDNYECEEWTEKVTRLLYEGEGTEEEILHEIENQRKGNKSSYDSISPKELLEYIKCQIMRENWNAVLPKHQTDRYDIVRLYHDHFVTGININGKILTVFHKTENSRGEKLSNPVQPSNVFNRFAETIELAPNSFFDVVWMAYQNLVREAVREDSLFLNTVPDKMLKYLRKNRADLFLEELKDHFSQDIMYRLYGMQFEHESQLLQIIDSISEEKVETDDIVGFNAFYSQYRYRKIEKSIGFGDIFIVQNQMALGKDDILDNISNLRVICITAHCDCAHGKETSKMRNCYSFAIQTTQNIANVNKILTDPESSKSGLYDFIRNINGEVEVVKWDDNFIKLYIKDSIINDDGIIYAVYKNYELELKYIGTMKENYAQRIANKLFSYATRVGITYLSKE